MTKLSEQEHRDPVDGSPVTNEVAGEKSGRLPDVSTGNDEEAAIRRIKRARYDRGFQDAADGQPTTEANAEYQAGYASHRLLPTAPRAQGDDR